MNKIKPGDIVGLKVVEIRDDLVFVQLSNYSVTHIRQDHIHPLPAPNPEIGWLVEALREITHAWGTDREFLSSKAQELCDAFDAYLAAERNQVPTQPDLTALERAVVEAKLKQRQAMLDDSLDSITHSQLWERADAAADALLAARTPKTPLDRIRASFEVIDRDHDPECQDTVEWAELRRAIADAVKEAGK